MIKVTLEEIDDYGPREALGTALYLQEHAQNSEQYNEKMDKLAEIVLSSADDNILLKWAKGTELYRNECFDKLRDNADLMLQWARYIGDRNIQCFQNIMNNSQLNANKKLSTLLEWSVLIKNNLDTIADFISNSNESETIHTAFKFAFLYPQYANLMLSTLCKNSYINNESNKATIYEWLTTIECADNYLLKTILIINGHADDYISYYKEHYAPSYSYRDFYSDIPKEHVLGVII